MHTYFDIRRPHLFAHRGASAEAPENTLPAFTRAAEYGIRYLELDCHATRDGEIVVLHDAELERTTDGEGPVSQHTLAELERLDAGYRFTPDGQRFPFRGTGVRVPRFAEILKAFPEARLNLEVKQAEPAIAEQVVRMLREANASQRVLLAAAEEPILAEIAALDPGTALGSSTVDVIEFVKAAAERRLDSFKPRGHALQIPPDAFGRPLVTRELVQAAHALGLFVHVWTINDAAEMRRLAALGVDGVMSDDPRLLLATLAA
ncbi:MAG: glycerophosphodiester phosphodiesterase [Myxococcota bacterium]